MVKLKRILAILLVMVFVVSVSPAFSQARYGGKRIAASSDTELLLPAGTWVYGISIWASSANAFAGIYNVATLEATTASNLVDEIGEATQYDHADRPWPKAIYFANGVTVVVSSGTFFVDYGPEP